MPIYEYRCPNCGHVFDQFQPMSADNSDVKCPKCGTPRPERLFSAFAMSGGNTNRRANSTSSTSCGSGGFT